MVEVVMDDLNKKRASEALRLLKAFSQIDDQNVRDAILMLLETRVIEPGEEVSFVKLGLVDK